MRLLTVILLVFSLLLMDSHSVRVGDEERRIWTPVVLGLLTLVMLVRVPRLLRVSKAVVLSAPVVLFVTYLLWLGVTQFWSVAPGEGRNHILMLWITFLAALSLADEPPHRTALTVIGGLAVVFVVSWLGAAAGQSWVKGTEAAWRLKGVMRHQQVLALVTIAGMILALVWQLNRKRGGAPARRGWMTLFLAVAVVTLLATKGRSLAVFFVITVFAIYFFHLRGAAKTWVLVAGIVIGSTLYLAVDVLLPLVSKGNEDTLSGRLIVWELTMREIAHRPWGGYGFSTYQDYFKSMWNGWAPGHAHNLWLQVTFESGIVGATIYTFFLLAVITSGLRFQRQTGALSYSLALAVFCVLGGWTSVFIGEKLSTIYGLLLALSFQEAGLCRLSLGVASRPEPAAPAPIKSLAPLPA